MSYGQWRNRPLVDRVRLLRYLLPPLLVLVVVTYQLGVAQSLERDYGLIAHYGVEIGFYSLVGPVVTLLTLSWVERRLREQRRLEQQVQAQSEQLVSLTAISADAILSLDSSGKISSWNQGASRILGYQQEEVIEQPLSALLEEADLLESKIRHLGMLNGVEATAVAKNGQTLTVELSQAQLEETGDRSVASLIIMRDVTTRRERELIREQERARIARDLHDGVAQTLYFMALKADRVSQKVNQKSEWAAAEIKEIGQTTRQVIREVRRTIFSLRPPDWSEGKFYPAMERFVKEYAEQAGWRAEIDFMEPAISIRPRVELAAFRLVQESLNNAAKHAKASKIWVSLAPAHDETMLEVTVRDDGSGFVPGSGDNAGLGLSQMRERVEAIDGSITIDSQPGEGTVMTAMLPLTTHLDKVRV